ncbi:MAG: chitobiase/beta-hexosaminidase C-terminal domain-containing protein [Gammaproteobacteria bacterium]|nr:chitobiase/beta-hexosaminidase C-terminal domain-containing protein [Gammaproteobacteria bacterium]
MAPRAEPGGWRRAAALLAAVLCASQAGRASDIPDTDFVQVNDTVLAGAISNGFFYLGGAFTTVNGSSFPRLAKITLAQNQPVATWAPQMDATVRALAVSTNGASLYIGGDFTLIGAVARGRLAALSIASGAVIPTWNANGEGDVNGSIRALALAPDGRTLYIGGDFTTVGGVARNHIASVNTTTGAVLPWDPGADGSVRALALSSDGATLYAGGDFTVIGAQPRPGLAALQTVNAKAAGWNPAPVDGTVHALALAGATLYAGGDFGQIGGAARNNLAALDTGIDSDMALAWNPDVDGPVHALSLSSDGARLYAGGAFAAVNGVTPRNRIAGFRADIDSADTIAWDPGFDSAITSVDFLIASVDGSALYAGGDFTRIGATDLVGLAAFGIAAPLTTVDTEGGGYTSLSQVTLTCVDRAGAGCAEIYYTTDGSDPVTPVSYTAPVDVAITGDTTLRYFSVDADGNREVENTTVYAIDTSSPVTVNSLPGALYGSADIGEVELSCADDNIALGCTTYYTLDGTEPTTASTAYTEAISLAGLFPPADIDPDEVDPLLHLAGTVTLKYFSRDDAGNQEATQTVLYQVDLSGPAVGVSHAAGNYAGPIAVTLSCNDGTGSGCVDMYYTLDNSTPSDGNITDEDGNVIPRTTRYTDPIPISTGSVLRVLALDVAGNQTSGIVGIYSFTSDTGTDRNSVGGMDAAMLLLLALAWWRRISGDGLLKQGDRF